MCKVFCFNGKPTRLTSFPCNVVTTHPVRAKTIRQIVIPNLYLCVLKVFQAFVFASRRLKHF